MTVADLARDIDRFASAADASTTIQLRLIAMATGALRNPPASDKPTGPRHVAAERPKSDLSWDAPTGRQRRSVAACHPSAPHFMLFARATDEAEMAKWSFVLESDDGSETLEVADVEPELHGERLELLSVLRGLEALDQPSRVTVVTSSRYVYHGLSGALDDWRNNGWRWERHGRLVPVKNSDLWQRVDRALKYHRIQCRRWRIDRPHRSSRPQPRTSWERIRNPYRNEVAVTRSHTRLRWAQLALRRRWSERLDGWKLRLAQLGTSLVPNPWLG